MPKQNIEEKHIHTTYSTYNAIDTALHDVENASIHFSPKKELGQNFLHNMHIAQRIASLLQQKEGIYTLEIGAGRGAITQYIQKAHTLCIVERDPYWAGVHSKNTPTLCADALQVPYARLHSRNGALWQIIGNLPYNIASPLLWEILSLCDCYCVFMVQKEVGERLLAKEHTKNYGMLSVWVQSFCTPKKELLVPPSAFFPAPKVDSMVLSFTPHSTEVRENVPPTLSTFIHIAFAHRRKQLLPLLRKQYSNVNELAQELSLPNTVRTEELPITTLHTLARKLCP